MSLLENEKNICAVLKKKGDLQLEERPIPKPGKGEVLLAVKSVGICGSDVHYWTQGYIGDFVLKAPMIMGHESSGEVVGVGEGVVNLKIGDRVAVEPGVPCQTCSYCKGGRYNLCLDMKFCATPPIDGSLANYYVHPADFCYKLPDHVTFDEGALLEPLSVGVHACQRAGVSLGSKVLICGAGPIGLVCLLTAKACGASTIAITDIDSGRLEVAKQLGATYTIRVNTRDCRELANQISEIMGCQPDKTIECSGAQPAITTGIFATRSGGVMVLIGLGAPEIMLPIVDASVREVDIRGIFRYCNCYPVALEMISSGAVDVKPLITHSYNLHQTIDAFERAKTGEGGAIKVIIHI